MKDIDEKEIAAFEGMTAAAEKIAVISHMHPDGDAIGGTVAMHAYLASVGKHAELVYPHEWPDSLKFLDGPETSGDIIVHEEDPERAERTVADADLIICMDFNAFDRTGEQLSAALSHSRAGKILVDHHLFPDREKFDIVFSETEISSTSELFYHIMLKTSSICGKPENIPSIAATSCMTGMTTDTNNFANSVYPSTFRMAGELIGAGVDRDMILGRLFSSYREERVRLMGELLARNLVITAFGVAYMILDRKTIMEYGIMDGETEGFVNIPLSIGKVGMSIFLKEDKDRFRVSIRSKKGISANTCARLHFNGGGHEQASGGRLMKADGICTAEDAASYIEKVTDMFINGKA